ncbi:MAG: helix-turn-helix domain-containing protein [Thermoplasmata archaeon]|nr:helix-turn-helix domain-containing protein [Thermoplasmata archaeon]
MMTERTSDQKISRLLADIYSQKILSYTYKKPMSAQKLSSLCHIPIAACYRRIHDLERAGMLYIAFEKEIYKGRKVRLYRCSLKHAVLRFSDGKFKIKYDTMVDTPMESGDNGGAGESVEEAPDNGDNVETDQIMQGEPRDI